MKKIVLSFLVSVFAMGCGHMEVSDSKNEVQEQSSSPKKGVGEACTASSECSSGNCNVLVLEEAKTWVSACTVPWKDDTGANKPKVCVGEAVPRCVWRTATEPEPKIFYETTPCYFYPKS